MAVGKNATAMTRALTNLSIPLLRRMLADTRSHLGPDAEASRVIARVLREKEAAESSEQDRAVKEGSTG